MAFILLFKSQLTALIKNLCALDAKRVHYGTINYMPQAGFDPPKEKWQLRLNIVLLYPLSHHGWMCDTIYTGANKTGIFCVTEEVVWVCGNLRRLHRSKKNYRIIIVIGQIIGSGQINSFMCIESVITSLFTQNRWIIVFWIEKILKRLIIVKLSVWIGWGD